MSIITSSWFKLRILRAFHHGSPLQGVCYVR